MNSYRRNEGRSVRRLSLVTAAVILILVIDFLSGGIPRSFVRGASVSLWSAGSRVVRSVAESGFFSSRRALQSENNALRQELERFQMNSAEVNVLRGEVTALRSLVHLAERDSGITAPIISSVISSPYGTFIIAAGEEDGVAAGDLVLADTDGQSFVIGRVSETSKRRSLITEVFAPGTHIEISVRGAPFTLEGRGGGNARIEVPSAFAVAVGDPVFAPEIGGRAVGLVGALHEEPSAAYKDVFVHRNAPLSSIRFVYVISNEK